MGMFDRNWFPDAAKPGQPFFDDQGTRVDPSRPNRWGELRPGPAAAPDSTFNFLPTPGANLVRGTPTSPVAAPAPGTWESQDIMGKAAIAANKLVSGPSTRPATTDAPEKGAPKPPMTVTYPDFEPGGNTGGNNGKVVPVAKPALPTSYGPADGLAFRDRIQAKGTPGERVVNDYGLGGPSVVAMADKNGKFNSFSQGPTPGGGGGGSSAGGGVASDIAKVQGHLQHWEGQNTLTGMIMAKGLRSQLTNLRGMQVQQGQLGVQQRQVGLQEQTAYPQIAMATHKFGLATAGDPEYNAMRKFTAAGEGRIDATTMQNPVGGVTVVPNSVVVANGGVSMGLPGMSNIITQPQFAVPDVSKIGHLTPDYPPLR